MKSTAQRPIDDLGRIVLPIGLRRSLDIKPGDELEIYLEDNRIVMTKLQTACCFCGQTKALVSYRDKQVCRACLEHLKTV